MRKVLKAMVLTFVLAIPVCAGEMGCPRDDGNIGAPLAPPSSSEAARDGEMGAPLAPPSNSEAARDGNIGQPLAVSDVLASLLPGLLALF